MKTQLDFVSRLYFIGIGLLAEAGMVLLDDFDKERIALYAKIGGYQVIRT